MIKTDSQAEELFKIVLRNAKMMDLDELYQCALYNYSELQNRRGLQASSYFHVHQLVERFITKICSNSRNNIIDKEGFRIGGAKEMIRVKPTKQLSKKLKL